MRTLFTHHDIEFGAGGRMWPPWHASPLQQLTARIGGWLSTLRRRPARLRVSRLSERWIREMEARSRSGQFS